MTTLRSMQKLEVLHSLRFYLCMRPVHGLDDANQSGQLNRCAPERIGEAHSSGSCGGGSGVLGLGSSFNRRHSRLRCGERVAVGDGLFRFRMYKLTIDHYWLHDATIDDLRQNGLSAGKISEAA